MSASGVTGRKSGRPCAPCAESIACEPGEVIVGQPSSASWAVAAAPGRGRARGSSEALPTTPLEEPRMVVGFSDAKRPANRSLCDSLGCGGHRRRGTDPSARALWGRGATPTVAGSQAQPLCSRAEEGQYGYGSRSSGIEGSTGSVWAGARWRSTLRTYLRALGRSRVVAPPKLVAVHPGRRPTDRPCK